MKNARENTSKVLIYLSDSMSTKKQDCAIFEKRYMFRRYEFAYNGRITSLYYLQPLDP